MVDDIAARFGPCCFCGKEIEPTTPDPCQLTVETEDGLWQVWFTHARCFRKRLADIPEAPGLLEPAHF